MEFVLMAVMALFLFIKRKPSSVVVGNTAAQAVWVD
jgi:hypothetical protein